MGRAGAASAQWSRAWEGERMGEKDEKGRVEKGQAVGAGAEVRVQDEVAEVVANALRGRDVTHVAWVAAGGSNGGFYAAHYFMERECATVASHMYTSNEFVLAPPAYVDEHTLCVICSMRGTKETCEAARVAKELGAATVALYVNESDLTRTCDQKIAYESIALDESRTERVNSSIALMIAMSLANQVEGYDRYDEAMHAFDVVDGIYRKAFARMQEPARQWAARMAGERTIYVMGSGPAYGSAYIFSICNIEEMLQIDSPTINSCEFFHGPFEVLDATKPVFLLLSAGRCRDRQGLHDAPLHVEGGVLGARLRQRSFWQGCALPVITCGSYGGTPLGLRGKASRFHQRLAVLLPRGCHRMYRSPAKMNHLFLVVIDHYHNNNKTYMMSATSGQQGEVGTT